MTSAPPSAAADASLKWHVGRTLSLAWPVMGARIGMILMITVDSIMAGQAGKTALAHYGISLAPHVFVLVVGIGFLVGTIVLVGQADGAGRSRECGAIWHRSMMIAAGLGVVFGAFLLFGETILLLLGQSESMAAGGGRALLWFAPGMPAAMMYLATSFFLEGIGRPHAGMVVSLLGNLPNAALNWLLIEGHMGAPAMGAAGATLATTVTRWIILAALVAYVFRMADGERYGVRAAHAAGWQMVRRLARLGTPLAVATGLESASFMTMASFAGRLGETQMAAYQACMNVVSFAFMLAIGLSTATSVRAANAVGRGDRRGLALAGWLGFALLVALMLLLSVLVVWQRDFLASLYSDVDEVRAIARAGYFWVAAVLMFDGGQAVLMGAHRGAADVMVPTAMQGFAFWGVGVPVAYILAFQIGFGVQGILAGIFAGMAVSMLLLAARFTVVSRRPVAAAYT
ncbi:MATE family efflux transporter [Ferruginivarius sediminum]|uniref:Multidrug-efflux transporter n=1 Tax=Ferruginivarius sediminum TaxID=2661937 RepID=A0A369TKJ1_9PROT|nr:MATE family efflux transporter [Ferruginivarius sediminum]RDD63436.1 MATE family efflux transporter [Ferruginivarius sediminum]